MPFLSLSLFLFLFLSFFFPSFSSYLEIPRTFDVLFFGGGEFKQRGKLKDNSNNNNNNNNNKEKEA